MVEISAALVKELRDLTGAPMMDSKRALQDTNGDMEAAVRVLREKGMAGAAKRSDRATPEGKVSYTLADDNARGTMVAVGCETEPVSNNDEFLAFANKVLETVDFAPNSCDPHGLAMHNGALISCDAGIHPGWPNNDSPTSGWIFRIDLV